MRSSGAAGGMLEDLASLAWTYGDEPDNNDIYVTVFDVTGTGVIVGIWAALETATHQTLFQLTIDGTVRYSNEMIQSGAGQSGVYSLIYFATSAKLEMKNAPGGASSAVFYGIVGTK